jgi:hypothetical protein
VAGLPGPGGDADPVSGSELALDAGDVVLDGAGRDEELKGDLDVGPPLGDQPDDVEFASGEGSARRWLAGRTGELTQQPYGDLGLISMSPAIAARTASASGRTLRA